ncbi:class II fumarate hydratase [Gayadomonas joobiniege]|uniref:class II fumarate hydratase n=1 Tax=Gayadomonas joobiniege TaxID=1234606 RepID=UPI00035CDC16|nr:class II fumarate hydratase [Gayadomonas joobiniege]
MSKYRMEKDSMGELQVPQSALYGAQTQRAVENFPISGIKMPETFIRALILLKQTAAQANVHLGALPKDKGKAIKTACQHLLNDQNLMQHFPVDVFQTGSGTSTNMNANEVIANLASRQSEIKIHPNDDVNLAQSSNDVIPSCIQISAVLTVNDQLIPALEYAIIRLKAREKEFSNVCKTGRTHLMDAMPIRFDQVLSGWRAQLQMNLDAIYPVLQQMQKLPLGGTAVGTGVNTADGFSNLFNQLLSEHTQQPFATADNFFALISAQDNSVRLSGILKAIATSLMKIANDLRWMNSGPLAGLSEIKLPALQPGSSIMPGKVNPVIPESAAMVAAQVFGNDTSITVAGQSGNFELNVMLPLVARNLLESIEILANALNLMTDKAISVFTINDKNIITSLNRNPVLVTALNPIIGYEKAAKIAKIAYAQNKPIIEVAKAETDLPEDQLKRLLDPNNLTGR